MIKEQFEADLDLDFYLSRNRVYAFRSCKIDIDVDFERVGIYFGTIEKDGLRLSIEGSFIVGKVAKKNVLELKDSEAVKWLKGENLKVEKSDGYWIVKWGKYFLGCGKVSKGILKNYIPKDRRISD